MESGAGTFLVVMMDPISHGQITVIISHQDYTHQPASQPASQPAYKSKSDQTRQEDKLNKWEMLVGGGGGGWWEIREIISNKCIPCNLALTIKAPDSHSQSHTVYLMSWLFHSAVMSDKPGLS